MQTLADYTSISPQLLLGQEMRRRRRAQQGGDLFPASGDTISPDPNRPLLRDYLPTMGAQYQPPAGEPMAPSTMSTDDPVSPSAAAPAPSGGQQGDKRLPGWAQALLLVGGLGALSRDKGAMTLLTGAGQGYMQGLQQRRAAELAQRKAGSEMAYQGAQTLEAMQRAKYLQQQGDDLDWRHTNDPAKDALAMLPSLATWAATQPQETQANVMGFLRDYAPKLFQGGSLAQSPSPSQVPATTNEPTTFTDGPAQLKLGMGQAPPVESATLRQFTSAAPPPAAAPADINGPLFAMTPEQKATVAGIDKTNAETKKINTETDDKLIDRHSIKAFYDFIEDKPLFMHPQLTREYNIEHGTNFKEQMYPLDVIKQANVDNTVEDTQGKRAARTGPAAFHAAIDNLPHAEQYDAVTRYNASHGTNYNRPGENGQGWYEPDVKTASEINSNNASTAKTQIDTKLAPAKFGEDRRHNIATEGIAATNANTARGRLDFENRKWNADETRLTQKSYTGLVAERGEIAKDLASIAYALSGNATDSAGNKIALDPTTRQAYLTRQTHLEKRNAEIEKVLVGAQKTSTDPVFGPAGVMVYDGETIRPLPPVNGSLRAYTTNTGGLTLPDQQPPDGGQIPSGVPGLTIDPTTQIVYKNGVSTGQTYDQIMQRRKKK